MVCLCAPIEQRLSTSNSPRTPPTPLCSHLLRGQDRRAARAFRASSLLKPSATTTTTVPTPFP